MQFIVGELVRKAFFLTLRIEVLSQSISDSLRRFIECIASAEKLCLSSKKQQNNEIIQFTKDDCGHFNMNCLSSKL